MSLMQLLVVSKSVEVASRDNPYKVVGQGSLPKMGAEDRNGSKTAENASTSTKTEPDSLPLFEASAQNFAQPVNPVAEPTPAQRWVLGRFRKANTPDVPVAKQRELALENLKVVRNDLKDNDLELSGKVPGNVGKQVEANPFTPSQIVPEKSVLTGFKTFIDKTLRRVKTFFNQG